MTDQTASQTQATALLGRAFKALDEWRHLPAYQLERRVDVFFGLLLPTIVEAEFGPKKEHSRIIPEFPLHKRLLGLSSGSRETDNNNQSIKVDFAVFCKGSEQKHIFLVELKTDNRSIDCKQLSRMKKAKDAQAETLLNGVIECARYSKSPRKYAHLIWKLHEIGCITSSCDLTVMNLKSNRPGLTEEFRRLNVCNSWSGAKIELALIYPGREQKTHSSRVQEILADLPSWLRLVDFLTVARAIGESPLSSLLERWADVEAGSTNPWAD